MREWGVGDEEDKGDKEDKEEGAGRREQGAYFDCAQ
jgi:hypothetical protein